MLHSGECLKVLFVLLEFLSKYSLIEIILFNGNVYFTLNI